MSRAWEVVSHGHDGSGDGVRISWKVWSFDGILLSDSSHGWIYYVVEFTTLSLRNVYLLLLDHTLLG
jgi:hypothetical protein